MLAATLVAAGCGGGTTATPQAQVLSPQPLSVSFSPQPVNSTGQSATLTLVNSSRMTAQVTSIAAIPYPVFRVAVPSAGLVLHPGEALTLRVSFAPSQRGTYSGFLRVSGNAAFHFPSLHSGSSGVITQPFNVGVPVSGRALDASTRPSNNTAWIKISPTSATVSSSQTVQFQATSNGPYQPALTWTAALGTITATGVYTSPQVSSPTVDTIIVSSRSNPNISAAAAVVVNPTPPTCQSNCGPVAPPVSSGPAYYLSPGGNDSNAGTQAAPWRTFAHAIAALRPGMSLLLLDGTYNNSTGTGLPNINCTANAVNGTSSSPITLAALNERQAFIKGDGSASPLQVQNCSYWHITGLHLENGDFPYEPDGNGNSGASVVYLYNDNHLTVNRNVVARDNRYFNSMLILGYRTSNTTFEENESYYFHRHAMNVSYGGYNIFRRNYFNSRFYADLPGCQWGNPPAGVPRCSGVGAQDRGDSAISLYPDHDSIIENNVGENNETMMDIEDAYAPYAGDNEKFYGNISLNDIYGILDKARGNTDAYTAHNVFYQDVIVVNPISAAAYWRSPGSAACNRCSFINVSNNPISNFIADQDPLAVGGGSYTVNVQNSLSVGATAAGAYGFFVNTSSGTWNMTLSDLDANQNNINFSPQPQNGSTQNPQLGSCLAWVPAGSVLKGAGSNGSDIGASVLYQYVNGTLTSTPLWDPATGEFPHGATVSGLNDVAGASAFDVSNRLHVGTAGCPLPSGY